MERERERERKHETGGMAELGDSVQMSDDADAVQWHVIWEMGMCLALQ